VFYVARMKPTYTFCVQDQAVIIALMGTTISYRIGPGIPLVMNLDQVVRSKVPVYYVQAGIVIDQPEKIELAYDMVLDIRVLYQVKGGMPNITHSSFRIFEDFIIAVAPGVVIYDVLTDKQKSRNRLEFGNDLRNHVFSYGIEKGVGIMVYSPYFARHCSCVDLCDRLVRSDPPCFAARDLLSRIGMSEKDIGTILGCVRGFAEFIGKRYETAFFSLVSEDMKLPLQIFKSDMAAASPSYVPIRSKLQLPNYSASTPSFSVLNQEGVEEVVPPDLAHKKKKVVGKKSHAKRKK